MKQSIRVVILVAALGIAALAGAASHTENQTLYTIDASQPLHLDFGDALVHVLPWDRTEVSVSYTDRSVEEGLRGDIQVSGNTFTLTDYVAPVRERVAIVYRVSSWLPLIQFEEYRHSFVNAPAGMPPADYTIHVPHDAVVDVQAKIMWISGSQVVRADGQSVRITNSHLVDGFTGSAEHELFITRGTAEGQAEIRAQYVTIRDSMLAGDVTLHNIDPYGMGIEIRDVEGQQVSVMAATASNLQVEVRDSRIEGLRLVSGAEHGGITIQRSIIRRGVENHTGFTVIDR